MKRSRVVLASNNPGKLREFAALFAPLGIDLVPQAQLGISEADEPHPTFIENALAKARHASAASGLPAIADDSGLSVVALGGAPGVHSARWAASPTGVKSDADNNARLVRELVGVTDRRALYCCVLVLLRAPDDPQPVIAEGLWQGEILDVPRGTGGFGYDPYFLIPELDRTVAELSPEEKNRRSHRGVATRALVARLGALGLA